MLYTAKNFLHDDRGATSIEYCLMGSLIAVAIISAVQAFSQETINMYAYLVSSIIGASS